MISILTICALLFVGANAIEVPPYLHICGRLNPKLDDCIKASTMFIRPQLAQGIPELGVPAADPMIIDNLTLIETPNFKADTHNIKVYGLSKFEIKSVHMDQKKQQLEFTVFFPKLQMHADYDVKAHILVPIASKGPISLTAVQITAGITMKFKFVEKEGQKYVFYTAMTTKLKIHDYTANFESSDGLSPTLTTAINQVLGNSHEEILETVTPSLEKAVSETVLSIANKMSKSFPYDVFLPNRE